MGLDLEIYLRVNGEPPEELQHAAAKLGDLIPLEPDKGGMISDWYSPELPATHCIDTLVRYYSTNYRHGPIGDIIGLLIAAMNCQTVECVWYCSSEGHCDVVTADWLADFVRDCSRPLVKR